MKINLQFISSLSKEERLVIIDILLHKVEISSHGIHSHLGQTNDISILTLNDENDFAVGCAVWSFGYSTWKKRASEVDSFKQIHPR